MMQCNPGLFLHAARACAFVVALFLSASLPAQVATGPLEIRSPSATIVAPTRFAWCCELSPDETWLASCYGFFQGDVGRIRVWDLRTAKVKWEASEARGVRRVAISPDGSLVASGNYGGEIRFRDAATGEVRRSFDGGGGSVECVTFSADGQKLASCGNRRVLRLWDVATGRLLQALEGHTDVVYGVRFSANDELLLSYGRDRSVRIWNANDGSLLRTLTHPNPVHAAIFLPDGKQLATACEDGQVRIYRIDGDGVVATLPPHSSRQAFASALAASRDGKLLATGDAPRIRLWNTGDWQVAATLEGPQSYTWGLNFSRDAKTLFSAGTDSAIRVWNLADNAEKQRLSAPPNESNGAGRVSALAIAPDGKLVATAAGGQGIQIRDPLSGELEATLPARDALVVAFSPDGKTLGVAGGGLSVWDVRGGTLLQDVANATIAVAWSSDGKHYATGGSDNSIRVWDANTKQQVVVLEGHTDEVVAVAFSPDGKRLLSGSKDFTARVWDFEKQSTVATLKGHAAAINAIAYSADGKMIATASNDGTVKLWEVAGYRPRGTLAHQVPVVSVTFAADGQTVASGGEQGAIWLWDTLRGNQRKRMAEHFGPVRGLAFLPDDTGLISASEDQSIRFWKTAEPALRPLVTVSAHSPEALCVVFSPDGKWLVTGGADKNIAVREPVSGAIRRLLRGHTSRVNRLAVAPDSKQVASVSGDGTLRVWSILRGGEESLFHVWREKIAAGRSVAFSPDGRTVASGADDGTIKLWDVSEKKELRALTEQSLPVTSLAFTSGGSLLVSATGDWRNNREPGELRLWDVASGRELAQLKGCASEIKCIAVDPGGTLVASTEANSDLRLWDLASRTLLRTTRLESLSASLSFSPDGKHLVTGHYSGGISLWRTPEMVIVGHFTGHAKGIPGIAFSADGKSIASVGNDGRLGLWPANF
jgi:WD40 repeat protein